MSQKQVCADLGISKSALQVWVRDSELEDRGIQPASAGDVDARREQATMFERIRELEWLAKPVSGRDWDEAHLINAARDVWDEDRCQGYRLIPDRPSMTTASGATSPRLLRTGCG